MTLIISCLTENVVFQVSDRRLTRVRPPYGVQSDETNKAVLWNGCLAFGYTGFSEIEGVSTDLWIATAINKAGQGKNVEEVAHSICRQATAAFKNMNLPPSLKRHAFQICGWFYVNRLTCLRPGIVVIDNYIEPDGTYLATPRIDFRVSFQAPVLRRGYALDSVGFPLSNNEKKFIGRLVDKSIKRKSPSALGVLQALMAAMDEMANRHATVGKSLMMLCLPKDVVKHQEETGQMMVVAGGPKAFLPTFMYRTSTGVTSYYGPICVLDGCTVSHFEIVTPYKE